jgi:hypothetical protein
MKRTTERTTTRRKTTGFGHDPRESRYCFVLKRRHDGGAVIIERVGADDEPGEGEPLQTDTEKARLSAYLWERIERDAAIEFNERLLAAGERAAKWAAGETPLAPHFGKELTLLAWAVEDADPTNIPAMLANWRGLAPEERWWFYTTINATSGRAEHGADKGWRQAIKIAFAGNPVHVAPSALLSAPKPPKPKRAKPEPAAPKQESLALFNVDNEEDQSE